MSKLKKTQSNKELDLLLHKMTADQIRALTIKFTPQVIEESAEGGELPAHVAPPVHSSHTKTANDLDSLSADLDCFDL